MNADEFTAATGINDPAALEVFDNALNGPGRTFARRAAELAQELRDLGCSEDEVRAAVELLAWERRR